MKKSKIDMSKYEPVNVGHIWINAFDCINPTNETKLRLAENILDLLEKYRHIKLTINKS